MTLFDMAALFAHQDPFGGGFAAGLPVWFGAGFGAGMGAGGGGAKKKINRQLSQAIDDGAITILGKSGKELTADVLLQLLNDEYKKA